MITGLLAIVAGALVFDSAFAVPRYSAPVAQVGDSHAMESAEAATQNPSAPVLQRIKQEAQTSKTVVVKLMQRPLDMDFLKDSVGGVARKATGGTAAHIQVVAIDKSTGRVIDNFGVTGDFGGGGKARIFSEKDLDRYDSEPCGTYEMSSDDYYAAKERTIKQIEGGAIYEPYSGAGLKDMAKEGAWAGAQAVAPLGSIASAVGAVAGAVGGAMAANDIYETRRHDYGIHSDGNAKMSFPVVNCQAGGDMFVKNLAGLSTVVTVKKYIQPGEKVAQPDVCRDAANCSNGSKRKICVCAEPETFFAGVVMVQIIKSKKPSAQYYCRKCGGFRRGTMFDVIRTGSGIATYPGGVLPPDWDGKIYEKTELEEHVKNLLSGSDNSTKATAER